MIFREQAEQFIQQIGTRKREPVKIATLTAYKSLLKTSILPVIGSIELSEVQNGTIKPLVRSLSEKGRSAQTITSVVSLIKQIVKSAVDENGNQLFPRTWNNEFLDLPVINHSEQKAPVTSAKAIEKALKTEDRGLYALLAGSGLRVGEATALMVGPDDNKNSFWIPESATVVIRTTVAKGKIQSSPKTEAGNREVDLSPELNTFLCELLLDQELPNYGLLFQNENGGLMNDRTLYRHLKQSGIPGFHSLRRYRITHLETQGVPRGLQMFWTGHAGKETHDLYIKMGENLEVRKQWAKKAGLGFQLGSL